MAPAGDRSAPEGTGSLSGPDGVIPGYAHGTGSFRCRVADPTPPDAGPGPETSGIVFRGRRYRGWRLSALAVTERTCRRIVTAIRRFFTTLRADRPGDPAVFYQLKGGSSRRSGIFFKRSPAEYIGGPVIFMNSGPARECVMLPPEGPERAPYRGRKRRYDHIRSFDRSGHHVQPRHSV